MSESAPTLRCSTCPPSSVRPLVRAGVLTLVVVPTVLMAVISVRLDAWFVAALLLLFPPLTAIAIIDARRHRIPNALVLLALAVAAVMVGARAFTQTEVAVRALLSGVVVGLSYLLLWRFAGLGLGDVKLAATLALVAGWSGWQTVVAFVVLAHLLQVPFAVWRLARRRRDQIAFAPALVVGLYLAIAVVHRV